MKRTGDDVLSRLENVLVAAMRGQFILIFQNLKPFNKAGKSD